MAQTQEVRGVHTAVFKDNTDNLMKVVYRGTVVVAWNNEKIVLNTAGWKTATTKTRMNQASNQYQLAYTVYQKASEWFVSVNRTGEVLKFEGDSLTITR